MIDFLSPVQLLFQVSPTSVGHILDFQRNSKFRTRTSNLLLEQTIELLRYFSAFLLLLVTVRHSYDMIPGPNIVVLAFESRCCSICLILQINMTRIIEQNIQKAIIRLIIS